ncbi:hypothetical protein DFH09DRAFT_1087524 [Mycena vulgaris]|nr:hypothetical protein DFH09DRAFT_1087524 [Mycena vulgaris]
MTRLWGVLRLQGWLFKSTRTGVHPNFEKLFLHEKYEGTWPVGMSQHGSTAGTSRSSQVSERAARHGEEGVVLRPERARSNQPQDRIPGDDMSCGVDFRDPPDSVLLEAFTKYGCENSGSSLTEKDQRSRLELDFGLAIGRNKLYPLRKQVGVDSVRKSKKTRSSIETSQLVLDLKEGDVAGGWGVTQLKGHLVCGIESIQKATKNWPNKGFGWVPASISYVTSGHPLGIPLGVDIFPEVFIPRGLEW